MTTFAYEARDRFGKLIKGTIGDESVQAVSNRLQAAGFIPVRIERNLTTKGFSIPFLDRVKAQELNLFTRQLLTLQRAGLPLLAGLRVLEEQCVNPFLKKAIIHIIIDIESGLSLHESLARQPKIFNTMYVNMIEAGEVSGRLDDILERVAILGERNNETQMKIKSALRYPMLTFIAMAAAFVAVITLVMPRFVDLFAQFKTQLPLPTRILLGIDNIARHHWIEAISVIGITVFFLRRYVNTKGGKRRFHSMILKLPIFGPLLKEIYMSRFSRNLSTLIQSGLPALQAMELAGNAVDNVVIKEAADGIQESVKEGKGMSEPMKESKLFSPMVVQMIAVGEETGKIDELLNYVADYYDKETDLKVKDLTSLIEPMLIVFMGGLVLLLALGVYLPMWNMVNLFKKA